MTHHIQTDIQSEQIMIFPASRIHYFLDEKKGKKERKKERGRKEKIVMRQSILQI